MRLLKILAMVIIGLSVPVFSSFGGAPKSTTPKTVLSMIERESAKVVLRRLYHESATFDQVLSGIETGQRAWLVVAYKLRAVSDAGASSMLDEALSRAMLKNPEDTLLFFGNDAVPSELSDSFCVRLVALEPKEGEVPYLRKVESALLRIKQPSLPWRNALCLQQVREQIARTNKARN
jgi:hypothetical protein